MECVHKNISTCHYTYVTQFRAHQEQVCSESYSKHCSITFAKIPEVENVQKCYKPLVSVCDEDSDSEDEEYVGHDLDCEGCRTGKCQGWISAATMREKKRREDKRKERRERDERQSMGEICPMEEGGTLQTVSDMEMKKLQINSLKSLKKKIK